MKFNVVINREECKGCGICMTWCKKKLIREDRSCLNKNVVHSAMIENMEECVGCLNCALMCPDSVISIEKLDNQ